MSANETNARAVVAAGGLTWALGLLSSNDPEILRTAWGCLSLLSKYGMSVVDRERLQREREREREKERERERERTENHGGEATRERARERERERKRELENQR